MSGATQLVHGRARAGGLPRDSEHIFHTKTARSSHQKPEIFLFAGPPQSAAGTLRLIIMHAREGKERRQAGRLNRRASSSTFARVEVKSRSRRQCRTNNSFAFGKSESGKNGGDVGRGEGGRWNSARNYNCSNNRESRPEGESETLTDNCRPMILSVRFHLLRRTDGMS